MKHYPRIHQIWIWQSFKVPDLAQLQNFKVSKRHQKLQSFKVSKIDISNYKIPQTLFQNFEFPRSQDCKFPKHVKAQTPFSRMILFKNAFLNFLKLFKAIWHIQIHK